MIRPRNAWGARPPRSTPAWLPNDVGIAVHWNGPGLGAYDQSRVPGLLRGIQNYHMGSNGWVDVAYSFFVDRFGTIWAGRGWNARSAANGSNDGNSHYLAVYYLGGRGDPFTPEAAAGIQQLVAEHVRRGGRAEVTGHRDHTSTECPGADIYGWVTVGGPFGGGPLAPATTIPEEDLPLNATDLIAIDELINRGVERVHAAVQADINRAVAGVAAPALDYDKLADAIVRRAINPQT